MKKVQSQRGWAKAQITRTLDAARKLDEAETKEKLSCRSQKLEEAYHNLQVCSQELYAFIDEANFVDPADDIEEYEDKYFEAHSLLAKALEDKRILLQLPSEEAASLANNKDTIKMLAEQQASFLESFTNANNTSRIHLAQIKIPAFSGRYQDWTAFKDIFQSAVDSKPGLTSTQKFHYLTSYLEGDALNLVKHISVTENNYAEAWDRLVQRYDKKPLIVRSFVQSFLSLPSCSSNNVSSLRKLTDGADETIRGLNALNSNGRDPWLIQILSNKLDDETKREWAKQSDSHAESTFNDFLEFLSHRCDALESCATAFSRSSSARRPIVNFANSNEKSHSKCAYCQDTHTIAQCNKFKLLSEKSRRSFVKEKTLCYNCLSRTHIVSKCPSLYRCRVCNLKHHTLVHSNQTSPSSSSRVDANGNSLNANMTEQQGSTTAISNHTNTFSAQTQTLLPTAQVAVIDKWGNRVNCRLLLDTGSTVSFITEAFVQRCGLSRRNARVSVQGLSSCNAGVTRGRVQLALHSNTSTNSFELEAFILPKLTANVPAECFNLSSNAWNEILQLPLADKAFGVPGPIDLLVGSDYLWNIYNGERKQFGSGLPLALNSIFGWVVSGACAAVEETIAHALTHHAVIDDLDALVRSFMDIERVATSERTIEKADPAERHFVATHTRASDGTYIVKYPFIEQAPVIATTLPQAMRRFQHMERKFRSNFDLLQQYRNFMREYLTLGHMHRIPKHEVNVNEEECFYLPHHAILRPDSTTTKCRVVFDGSCKDSSGVSLNNRLYVGPPIQRDLFGVLIRFRQHRYVFSTDIEKMFRGISVSPEQTDYQRIVWRESENDPIEHYRLLTVTYGLASSPFLAVRVLKQLAEEYKHEFSRAAHALKNDAYVDDIPTGCDSVEDLIALKTELIALLAKANFKLQKWCSNCWPLLETLPEEKCEFKPINFDSTADSCVKLLGLQWNPCTDEFLLKIKPFDIREPTKRIVLSETAKIYDPLGVVAPTVVLFKILFQELWYLGLDWDDQLPDNLRDRWHKYMHELSCLTKIRVPRHIPSSNGSIELHGFADASAVAYGAVVYSRAQIKDKFVINIVCSKTRVAPLKPISIPRLELSAAYLLTNLITTVKSSLTIQISTICCWSDSEIVLHWLSSPPRRWNAFVCNRTAQILDVCPRSQWHHVRSDDNPADCASRGLLPSSLAEHHLWWHGPPWLSSPASQWPKSKLSRASEIEEFAISEQSRSKPILLCTTKTNHPLELLINKLSSWSRLVRTVAYCHRFINACSGVRPTISNSLTTKELKQATVTLLKHVQHRAFAADIQHLQQCKELSAKSPLIRYTPFLDSDVLLRVGGRLKHANIQFSMKYPILLPKSSNVSLLILRYLHVKHLHAGVEATFATARQQYWILGCRNLIRKVVFSCKICFMQRKATSKQLMGDLPAPRLQPTRCFLHCGLDYAGPVPIKLSKTRNAKIGKAWFAIFICLSTKAIHIELVSDLTSEAFIAAFRRFVARRGKPSDLYSDNGTNFHGARRTLDELQQLASSQAHIEEVSTALAMDGIQWHYIPPSAPHFGGLWESGIRSIKLHLRRIVGSSTLTFEEYYTVLTQIEALLNSRPLCTISDTELNPLTPAHFMVGEPYTAIPDPSLLDINPNRLDRWRHLQAMVQGFWKRWRSEYLTTLQQRPKWNRSQPNIDKGALVVLKEPSLPPSKWLTGRVIEAIRGDDNLVRVVLVKTAHGEYRRPITKIAVLPNSEASVQGGRYVEE